MHRLCQKAKRCLQHISCIYHESTQFSVNIIFPIPISAQKFIENTTSDAVQKLSDQSADFSNTDKSLCTAFNTRVHQKSLHGAVQFIHQLTFSCLKNIDFNMAWNRSSISSSETPSNKPSLRILPFSLCPSLNPCGSSSSLLAK